MQICIFSLRGWWSNNRMLYWCGCRLSGISRPLSSRKTCSWTWNIGDRSRCSGGSQPRSECEGCFLCIVSIRCLLSLAMLVPQQIDEDAHCTKKKNKKCWYTPSGHNILVATWSRSNSRIIWNQLKLNFSPRNSNSIVRRKIWESVQMHHLSPHLYFSLTRQACNKWVNNFYWWKQYQNHPLLCLEITFLSYNYFSSWKWKNNMVFEDSRL